MRVSAVHLRQLSRLLQPELRLREVGARHCFLAADPSAGEDRNLQPHGHHPVGYEVRTEGRDAIGIAQLEELRVQGNLGQPLALGRPEQSALSLDRLIGLAHRGAGAGAGVARIRDYLRETGRVDQRGVAQLRGERDRLVQRKVQQLLEPIVRHVAVGPALNDHGPLVVASDPGPQQIELRLVAHLTRQAGLAQRGVGLLQCRLGDHQQPVGQRRIVVGAGHVEQQLSLGRGQTQRRASGVGAGGATLPAHLPAAEQRLRKREAEAEGVDPAERQVAKAGKRIGAAGAGDGALQRVQPLLHRERGVGHELPADLGRNGGGVAAGLERGELALQRAQVVRRPGYLGEVAAPGPLPVALRPGQLFPGDAYGLAVSFGDLQRLGQGERPSR